MFKYNKLSSAIFIALAASSSAVAQEQDTQQEEAETSKQIETINVTATKRTTNIQQTPTAVQALSSRDLKEQNIGNFDDYAQYVPNVTSSGRGPGQNDVFIRGMSIQPITVMLSGAQGTMPNVALYVDEQPVTAPGRNLDVYATDLQRIEVLPGPQGTLFGASSQAGTIRYITKKPVLGAFEAGFTTGFETMAEGEMSSSAEGYINIPVTNDLAVRGAFYNVNRGGYIDNVAGEFSIDPNNPNYRSMDPSMEALMDDGTEFTSAFNTHLAEEDFNDSYYKGFRLSAKYLINSNWELLLQHQAQDLGADGVFDYDPDVGDLDVERYYPDELEDSFDLTTWTLDGRLGALEVLYTGGYLNREIEQSVDYTGYNTSGTFIVYYTCNYGDDGMAENCVDPTKGFKGYQEHNRFTQEARINYDFTDNARITAGVFYDDFEINTQDDYVYFSNPEELGFVPNAPMEGVYANNPNTRPPRVGFFNDITRTEEQIAAFGEFTYDFTEQWAATVGLRWYDMESDFYGQSSFASKGTDGDAGRDYNSTAGHTDEPLEQDDVIPKFTLSYQYTPNTLFFATYSEGFRPGGFNRAGGQGTEETGVVNTVYESDEVVNYEFGWKSLMLDNSLRWNGNAYFVEWNDMQITRLDTDISILTFVDNAADSEIRGLETDFTWRMTDNFTFSGALSYNDTELTRTGQGIVRTLPIGSELPLTPKVQGNLRGRYTWTLENNWDAFAQVGWIYAGETYPSLVAAEVEQAGGKQDSYNIGNASIGVMKDQWSAKLYIKNITDERAELYTNTQDDILRTTTNRPRSIGLSVSYSFY
ncbi:TonB-dependent receptor [Idiomarina abyssalis]|jgi:outer membrane receptor protein involved in Fe transport|uniref:TonB-dependent receptor n=1 Tax=Idiomarina abyssalis TaxID=86102 RepID=UPI003A91CD73|tara:strand:- start:3424 stop:5865 length:2442 start_codon:yes stop_codon:yes gene_type:complete